MEAGRHRNRQKMAARGLSFGGMFGLHRSSELAETPRSCSLAAGLLWRLACVVLRRSGSGEMAEGAFVRETRRKKKRRERDTWNFLRRGEIKNCGYL